MNEHPCEHGTSPGDACDICWDRKRKEAAEKKKIEKTQCRYEKPWVGPCTNQRPCVEHYDLKCASCGKKAVRGCDTALSLVCGTPLCRTCGCPSCRSVGRPMSMAEALKAHAAEEALEDVRNFHGVGPKPDLRNQGIRLDAHAVVERAVEEGIAYGIDRAHKHTDYPTRDHLQLEIEAAVMNALAEVIKWD